MREDETLKILGSNVDLDHPTEVSVELTLDHEIPLNAMKVVANINIQKLARVSLKKCFKEKIAFYAIPIGGAVGMWGAVTLNYLQHTQNSHPSTLGGALFTGGFVALSQGYALSVFSQLIARDSKRFKKLQLMAAEPVEAEEILVKKQGEFENRKITYRVAKQLGKAALQINNLEDRNHYWRVAIAGIASIAVGAGVTISCLK